MPKIIAHLRERLLSEARRQVGELGYGAVTVRGVASACGVGTGTVYNYFRSKEHLIASFIAEDWRETMLRIETRSAGLDARGILSLEYDELGTFSLQYRKLFSDPSAIRTFSALSREKHITLRDQLAKPVENALQSDCKDAPFIAQFLAESLLTWTNTDVPKERLFGAMDPILAAHSNTKESDRV